jgi:hypothetical protein
MQARSAARNAALLLPVYRTAIRETAVHMSAQSMQARMHWRISISSAEQASAQDVQITAQYMACLAASASGSLIWPCTAGCDAIILRMDIISLSRLSLPTLRPFGCSVQNAWASLKRLERCGALG